ncbi:MAG: hypothetical protein WCP52_02170 [Bacteroidota bacterium]
MKEIEVKTSGNKEGENTYLYLSTVKFEHLKYLGNIEFNVELFVANKKDGNEVYFIDEFNMSDVFEHLSRKATIEKLIEVMNDYDLLVKEYVLSTEEFRLQSVVGKDVLIQMTGEKKSLKMLMDKLYDLWDIPNLTVTLELVSKIRSGRLLEISGADIKIVRDMPSPHYLIYWLIQDFEKRVIGKAQEIYPQRFYMC